MNWKYDIFKDGLYGGYLLDSGFFAQWLYKYLRFFDLDFECSELLHRELAILVLVEAFHKM